MGVALINISFGIFMLVFIVKSATQTNHGQTTEIGTKFIPRSTSTSNLLRFFGNSYIRYNFDQLSGEVLETSSTETFSFQFITEKSDGLMMIFNATNGNDWLIGMVDSVLIFGFYDGQVGSKHVPLQHALNDFRWHLVKIAKDGKQIKATKAPRSNREIILTLSDLGFGDGIVSSDVWNTGSYVWDTTPAPTATYPSDHPTVDTTFTTDNPVPYFKIIRTCSQDLVIILDASTSITAKNYALMLQFVKDLLGNFDIDSGVVRVGVLIYSTEVEMQFHLNQYKTRDEIFAAVDAIPYLYGSTNTADALETMHTQMFSRSKGDRTDVPNTCILVTDGVSKLNSWRTIPEAVAARDKNIHVYAVGIGLGSTREMNGIASVPARDNSITVKEFDQLKGLDKTICADICPALTMITPGDDDEVNIIENTTETFICEITSNHSTAVIEWYIDPGTPLDLTDDVHILTNISQSDTFRIDNMTSVDSTLTFSPDRSYTDKRLYCTIPPRTFSEGHMMSRMKPRLNILYRPIVEHLDAISIAEGSPLTVDCSFTEGVPAETTIKWIRDIDTKIWHSRRLHIESVERSDAGVYTCTASNIMVPSRGTQSYRGTDVKHFILTVQFGASVTSFYIDGFEGNDTVTVNGTDREHVLFKCRASGNPSANITLTGESYYQKNVIRTLKTVTANSLEYPMYTNHSSCVYNGNYSCMAENVHNNYTSSMETVELIVKCLFPVKSIDWYGRCEIHEAFTFTFTAIGYPPPMFVWKKLINGDWNPLENDNNTKITSDDRQSNLTIHSVTPDDFGEYLVVVTNDVGRYEPRFYLDLYAGQEGTSIIAETSTSWHLITVGVGVAVGLVVLVTIIVLVRQHRLHHGTVGQANRVSSFGMVSGRLVGQANVNTGGMVPGRLPVDAGQVPGRV